MEVVIGVQLSSREIRLEVPGDSSDELRKQIEKVFKDVGGGANPVLWVTDKDGRTVGVPADKLAYIEIGTDKGSKRVGFTTTDASG